jgi:hypothetical protein
MVEKKGAGHFQAICNLRLKKKGRVGESAGTAWMDAIIGGGWGKFPF